ncbi:unnamed protein product [Rotaria sp. Silwood2]|nr:unnamed protein product [Rotaria sp. Silwood2]
MQLMKLYSELGRIYYMTKHFDSALENYTKSLQLRLRILPVDDLKFIEIYENLDDLYYQKQNSNNRMNISIDDRLHSERFASLTYYTIGHVFNQMNNYKKALFYYDNAHRIELQMSTPNPLDIDEYKEINTSNFSIIIRKLFNDNIIRRCGLFGHRFCRTSMELYIERFLTFFSETQSQINVEVRDVMVALS